RLARFEDPLAHARDVAAQLSDEEKKEVLDAHPAIGAKTMSARSAVEQGDDDTPELDELNRAYEEKFGFRFVVFVNRRPKSEIVPPELPDPLYWFKWEAYTTWLSGVALYVVVFFIHPQTFLVDRSVAVLLGWEAIVIALGGLVVAWVVYDALCRLLGHEER